MVGAKGQDRMRAAHAHIRNMGEEEREKLAATEDVSKGKGCPKCRFAGCSKCR